MKNRRIIWIALGFSIFIAFFLSQIASSFPDGLEKVAEKGGFSVRAKEPGSWSKSPAPDYQFPGLKNEKIATGLAGVAGTLVVFLLGFSLSHLLKPRKDKE
jgi:cobalt/nickel transport protein